MTPNQQKALTYIRDYTLANDGVSPTYAEIGKFMGFASVSNVAPVISALKARGYISNIKNHARSIEVTSKGERVLGASAAAKESEK